MLKSIPTFYDNHKFRSRLEARWAVFFNKLRIRYQYEHEGYVIGNSPYLPDFYLPDQDYWIEIKGEKPTTGDQGKLYGLAESTKCEKAFIFWGEFTVPDKKYGYIGDGAYLIYPYQDNYHMWCECSKCKALEITFEARLDRLSCGCKVNGDGNSDRLRDAYKAASEAQFEHGKKG